MVKGDTRQVRNPQKAGVAWQCSMWAQQWLKDCKHPAALSLPGGYLERHMEELLWFDTRFLFELDPDQFALTSKKLRELRRCNVGFTLRELANTSIQSTNIFYANQPEEADGCYRDWDITGTINEAFRYGLEHATDTAFRARGPQALALTMSVRHISRAESVKKWSELMRTYSKQHNRPCKVKHRIDYGRANRGCGNMMVLRCEIS